MTRTRKTKSAYAVKVGDRYAGIGLKRAAMLELVRAALNGPGTAKIEIEKDGKIIAWTHVNPRTRRIEWAHA